MPKLISFDIGIKNLAYCIFDLSMISILDWNVIDLSVDENKKENQMNEKCNCILKSKKICSKTSKYSIDSLFFCETHAKNSSFQFPTKEFELSSLKKLSIDNLRTFLQEKNILNLEEIKKEKKIELIERIVKWKKIHVLQSLDVTNKKQKKKESLDFIQIGRNMCKHLSKLNLEDIDYVIIENQISPIANKMRTIQGMVAQIFIIKNIPNIQFVSSSNKLREYLGEKDKKTGEVVDEKTETIQNPDYKQHKKDGIRFTKEWLESEKSGFSFNEWNSFFNTYPKKQDDLADAFLQGIWFIRKKIGISIQL